MKKILILNIARLFSIPWLIIPFRLRKILFTIFFIIESRDEDPSRGLKSLFLIKDNLDWVINERALKYGSGIHPKHALMKYHDFFSSRIKDGSKVLDVGCGIGIVSLNVAKKLTKSLIIGVDINKQNILVAKDLLDKSNLRNVKFIHGDINNQKDLQADYVILSNILEHIENRTIFLKNIQKISNSKIFLIRVPNFERDWQIPMRKELGIYYFSDIDHKIEHTVEQLKNDIEKAGFIMKETITTWGEIWAKCEYGL
tara:strand:- start:1582 stop:2349 length:768 start_codon:yes stop_codon:yes gene_type:complete